MKKINTFLLLLSIANSSIVINAVGCAVTTLINNNKHLRIVLVEDLHIESQEEYYYNPLTSKQMETAKTASQDQGTIIQHIAKQYQKNMILLVERMSKTDYPNRLLSLLTPNSKNVENIDVLRQAFYDKCYKYKDYLALDHTFRKTMEDCYQGYLDKIQEISKLEISNKLKSSLETIENGVKKQKNKLFEKIMSDSWLSERYKPTSVAEIYNNLILLQRTKNIPGIGWGPELEILSNILDPQHKDITFIVLTGADHCDNLIRLFGYEGFKIDPRQSIEMHDGLKKVQHLHASYKDLTDLTTEWFPNTEQLGSILLKKKDT